MNNNLAYQENFHDDLKGVLKMKKKEFWAGVLTTLLVVCMIGTVSALTGKVTQEVQYNNIGVILDGKRLDLRDANGNSVEPFMYNNTNYLPVRAVAEALGLEVAFDNGQNAVVLSSKAAEDESQKPDELLFAKESVRFYYTGYTQTEEFFEVNLRIENDSDYTIDGRIGPDSLVGNKKIYMGLTCKTEPGRTSEGKITIKNSDIESAGLSDFKTIKASFMIHDTQNLPYQLDFGTGFITIRLKQ